MITTKTGSKTAVQGAEVLKENTALTVVKKKMTIAEKIDSLHKLEALTGKVEYLREAKQKIESFGSGEDGMTGAKLVFKCNFRDEFTVSNPKIIEELVKTCNLRVKESLILAEKEIEDFEIN